MNKAFKKPLFKWYLSKYYRGLIRWKRPISYNDWLRMQPDKFIKLMLGERKGELFIKSKYKIGHGGITGGFTLTKTDSTEFYNKQSDDWNEDKS